MSKKKTTKETSKTNVVKKSTTKTTTAEKRDEVSSAFKRMLSHADLSPTVDWNMGFLPEEAGWVAPQDRTTEAQKTQDAYIFDTPIVEEIFTSAGSNKTRPRLWQAVKTAFDKKLIPDEFLRKDTFKNISQIIGSCVGFGAGNMLLWASLIDALIRGQFERILIPYVPYIYGRGRLHSGIRGPGSGSLGSGQAKALQTDGYLPFDMDGLPNVNLKDCLYWTESIELQWSDGARIHEKWITEGKKHLVPTVARLTSTDQAAQLADSYYVFTIASNWGGNMQCRIQDGVLLNKRVTTWNHQMWVLDYIDHPKLGRLWWVGNNWRYPHGKDSGGEWDGNTGAPEGGFYITDRDLQSIISQRDSYAFADPQGFQDRSRALDWVMG